MHRQPRPLQTNPAMVLIVFATSPTRRAAGAAETAALATNDFAWVNLRDIAPAISGSSCGTRPQRTLLIVHSIRRGMQPLIRAGVARSLIAAETTLRRYNCRLKIWDAYRPREAQARLWKFAPNNDYLADPQNGSGSLHSWGVAVDATHRRRLGTATLHADRFRRLHTGVDVSLHWRRSSRAHSLVSSANNNGERRLLWIANRMVAFHANDWKRYVPERLAKLSNAVVLAATNDRLSSRPPAATGIRSCPHQSSPDLRVGDGLDRIGHCIFSAQSAGTDRHPCSRY